jgi:hypothetical protein
MEATKCLNNFEIFFDKMFHFKTKIDGQMAQEIVTKEELQFPCKTKRNGREWAGGGSGFSKSGWCAGNTNPTLCVCVSLFRGCSTRRRSHTFASAGKTSSSFFLFYYVFLFI